MVEGGCSQNSGRLVKVVLPSYFTLVSLGKKLTKKKQKKVVTFPKGVLMQLVVTEEEVEELQCCFGLEIPGFLSYSYSYYVLNA